MRTQLKSSFAIIILLIISLPSKSQSLDDKSVLKELIVTFLEKVDSKEMHDRFWAEDLIYTSSSGLRFGKETIMNGFSDDNNTDNKESTSVYTADDIVIQIYGETAIVAFKLINKDSKTNTVTEYLNSGTFVKRNDEWVVVNWQATKIPSN